MSTNRHYIWREMHKVCAPEWHAALQAMLEGKDSPHEQEFFEYLESQEHLQGLLHQYCQTWEKEIRKYPAKRVLQEIRQALEKDLYLE
jgi:hypothetical protein